jgi:hypothetical protein
MGLGERGRRVGVRSGSSSWEQEAKGGSTADL